uniref:N-terminal methionine N(alpha)-acetyltransferase NatC n=1 Tax=Romanomermis culicivorax TaxID=13658 RepID=A0A915I5C2_ROMCU
MSEGLELGDKNVSKRWLNGIIEVERNVNNCSSFPGKTAPNNTTSNLSRPNILPNNTYLIDQIINKLRSCEELLFHEMDEVLKKNEKNEKTTVPTTSLSVSFMKKGSNLVEESISAHVNVEALKNKEQSTLFDGTLSANAIDDQSEQANIDHSFLTNELFRKTLETKSRAIFDPGLVGGESNSSSKIEILRYENEMQLKDIMRLITRDLSEPYSIYTYRYFIHNWPHLCFLAKAGDLFVGAIVCKLALHGRNTRRGYIAMLAVDEDYRRLKIGTKLVSQAIEAMVVDGCDEVVLETEVTNNSAMKLYENLGFVRDKRLFRYYWNGVDAFRLKLWLRSPDFLQYL